MRTLLLCGHRAVTAPPAVFTKSPGQAKVDELDLAAGLVDTHDVLWFEVQVDDALFVDEADSIDDLQHVLDHFSLCQLKVFIDDSLKEFTARDPVEKHSVITCRSGFCSIKTPAQT